MQGVRPFLYNLHSSSRPYIYLTNVNTDYVVGFFSVVFTILITVRRVNVSTLLSISSTSRIADGVQNNMVSSEWARRPSRRNGLGDGRNNFR